MQKIGFDQPVSTGFLLGIGLGFALALWEALRVGPLFVFQGQEAILAFLGIGILVSVLWIVALRHRRQAGDANGGDRTG
jgi:hypothetical protein